MEKCTADNSGLLATELKATNHSLEEPNLKIRKMEGKMLYMNIITWAPDKREAVIERAEKTGV